MQGDTESGHVDDDVLPTPSSLKRKGKEKEDDSFMSVAKMISELPADSDWKMMEKIMTKDLLKETIGLLEKVIYVGL